MTATTAHPEFPLADGVIYLNHAAVAPWPRRTADAVKAFAEENLRSGAYHYAAWLKQVALLRDRLKTLIHAPSSDDIALVKNTSEGLSFVAYGLDWMPGDNIVSSDQEFPSNRVVWQSLESRGVEFRQADLAGAATPEDALFARVDRRTRLITISSVQFATGLRMDLTRIGRFCKARGILFCIDAIQSVGALRFDVQRYQADFVIADGHKWMLGPEGVGFFYSAPEARKLLSLTQFGWHMLENTCHFENAPWRLTDSARRFECGSLNMVGIHALSASISLLLETGMEAVERCVLERGSYLIERIGGLQDLTLLTPADEAQRSGIVLFRHNTADDARLFAHLRENGVVCARRGGGIRFSPHFYTPLPHLERAIQLCINP